MLHGAIPGFPYSAPVFVDSDDETHADPPLADSWVHPSGQQMRCPEYASWPGGTVTHHFAHGSDVGDALGLGEGGCGPSTLSELMAEP